MQIAGVFDHQLFGQGWQGTAYFFQKSIAYLKGWEIGVRKIAVVIGLLLATQWEGGAIAGIKAACLLLYGNTLFRQVHHSAGFELDGFFYIADRIQVLYFYFHPQCSSSFWTNGDVDYFEQLIKETPHYKAAANWLQGPVWSARNEQGLALKDFPVKPSSLARLIQLVEEGRLSFSIASSRIFPVLLKDRSAEPLDIAVSLNLLQSSDTSEIAAWVEQALAKMPDKVTEYRKGKKGLIGLFVGEVKKLSKGKADPRLTNQLLLEKLEN